MDGTKRKTTGDAIPPTPQLVDMGATPLWSLPLDHLEESALRSTLPQPDDQTIEPAALQQLISAEQSSTPTRIAPECSITQGQSIHGQRSRFGKQTPSLTRAATPDDSDDEDTLHVDKSADDVYMVNCNESSWTARWPLDADTTLDPALPTSARLAWHARHCELKTVKLNLAIAAANVASRTLAQDQDDDFTIRDVQPAGLSPSEGQQWERDLLLRNVMRVVQRKLRDGATLAIEVLSDAELSIKCAFPLCLSNNRSVPTSAHFVVLDNVPRTKSAGCYCLYCLESLWSGMGMNEPLPDATVTQHVAKTRPIDPTLMLDGPKHCEKDAACTALADLRIPDFGFDGPMDDNRLNAARISSKASSPLSTATVYQYRPRPSVDSSDPLPDSATMQGDDDDKDARGRSKVRPSLTHRASTASLAPTVLAQYASTPPSKLPAQPYTLSSKPELDGDGDAASQSSSPLSHKTNASVKVSREARDLATGFGEAFLEGQKAVAEHDDSPLRSASGHNTRRSTRAVGSKPSYVAAVPTPQSEVTSAVPGTRLVKGASALAEDIERTERRLQALYRTRAEIEKLLSPGEQQTVNYPHFTRNQAKQLTVSMDEFGIPYSDLMDKPVNCWAKQSPVETRSPQMTPERSPGLAGPVPSKSLKPKTSGTVHRTLRARCCNEYYPDEGRDTVTCAETDCIIGPHHVECIREEFTRDGSWRCKLCRCIEPSTDATPPASRDTLQSLFPQHFTTVRDPYNLSSSPTGAVKTTQSTATKRSNLPQLDGSADNEECSTKRSAPVIDPRSFPHLTELLASKHAPSTEELCALFPDFSRASSPPPPEVSALYDSPTSVTSTGLWRDPPTRFQQLAALIHAGKSLSESEKAAVGLWKAASKEQFHWEAHMARAAKLRQGIDDDEDLGDRKRVPAGAGMYRVACNGDGKIERLEDGEILEMKDGYVLEYDAKHERRWEDAQRELDAQAYEAQEAQKKKWEDVAKTSMRECYGKDLSAVFGEVQYNIRE